MATIIEEKKQPYFINIGEVFYPQYEEIVLLYAKCPFQSGENVLRLWQEQLRDWWTCDHFRRVEDGKFVFSQQVGGS